MIPVIRAGQSFRGAGRYYLADKRREGESVRTTRERVLFAVTRNCAHNDAGGAIDEMWATAKYANVLKKAAGISQGRAVTKPVKTIALSWHPDEQPSKEHMIATAEEYLTAMGWDEHQAIIVGHSDTKHPHVHIILSRLHPVTGRTLDDSNDRPRAQAWALEYELRHGRTLCTARAEQGRAARETLQSLLDQRNAERVKPALEIARRLSERRQHVLEVALMARELSPQQRAAAEHLIHGGDLGTLVGYAGSGKTRLLERTRRAYEAAGYRVRGAALAGIAARNLETGSGIEAQTLARLELAWSKGQQLLGSRDVLIIDEAGMVGAEQMTRVLAAVETAGAKVILVGDPEQLQPINSAAPYRAIVQAIDGAKLTEVQRQSADWQRQATKELAERETARALARYAAEGHVHEAATPAEARRALIEAWIAERKAEPDKQTLILAHRRVDVAELNRLARERLREEGLIGRDVRLEVARSRGSEERTWRAFAKGDEILFTRNDRELGVNNGTRGRIVATPVAGERLEVEIERDGRKRRLEVALSQYGHIEHGFAMTVHKAQGTTVDSAHVLASRGTDRHVAYVAMSRHRERLELHYARSEMQDEAGLARQLSRAPLPTHERGARAESELFCQERLKRDYAERPRPRQKERSAARSREHHDDMQSAAASFAESEERLKARPEPRLLHELPAGEARERLNERHKAEREQFFADAKTFRQALREEVYRRTLDDWREEWAKHHLEAGDLRFLARGSAARCEHDAKSKLHEGYVARAAELADEARAIHATAEAGIREMRDGLAADMRTAIRQRQAEAVAAFSNERASDLALLRERQADERRELKALIDKPGGAGAASAAKIVALIERGSQPLYAGDEQARRIGQILDRLDVIRNLEKDQAAMADDNQLSPEEQRRAAERRREQDEQQALFNKQAEKRIAEQQQTFNDLSEQAAKAQQQPAQTPAETERKTLLSDHARELEEQRKLGGGTTQAQGAQQEQRDEQARLDQMTPDQLRIELLRQAEEAAKRAREEEEKRQAERQRSAGERAEQALDLEARLSDPRQRAMQGLARHYDILRPYESQARAAMHEHGLFLAERKEAAEAIKKEQDPDQREILILTDRANVYAYQAHLAHRNAVLSEVSTGRYANAEAWQERQSVHDRFYEGMRHQLTGELGNVDAQKQYALEKRFKADAQDVREEIREKLIALELKRITEQEHASGQTAGTQHTQVGSSLSQASSINPSDMRAYVAEKQRELARDRERRHFRTASKEAARTQGTEADRSQDQDQEQGQGQRPGR